MEFLKIRGKEISDLERYTPWETETYSGKIKYKLDDGKEFEIYREILKIRTKNI